MQKETLDARLIDELSEDYAINVGVLMSTYNGEAYIEEQIESILDQDKNFGLDLYIRDDGSTDATVEILKRIEAEEPSVHVIRGKNIGITASYFSLISDVGEHDYYALSDQDDYWLPNKLQKSIDRLQAKEKKLAGKDVDEEEIDDEQSYVVQEVETERCSVPILYGCCSYLVDEHLEPTGVETQKRRRPLTFYNTIIQNILLGHNQVMNHALFELLQSEVLDFTKVYAHDLWIANLAAVKGEILFDNTPRTFYRQHKENELGFGIGSLGWLTKRVSRARHGEAKEIATQMQYFCEVHAEDLTEEEQEEMERFFDSESGFFKRFGYIVRTKLYRQKKSESFLFRMFYLFGGYKE